MWYNKSRPTNKEVFMWEYHLISEATNTVIHSGTEEECKMILAAFVKYGEREDKFMILEGELKMNTTKLSLNELDDLLACAFEGGSNYWYMIEKFGKPRSDDGLYFITREPLVSDSKGNEGQDEIRRTLLTPHVCWAALEKMKELYPKKYDSIVNGDYDADDADIFLQLAVLREVVYG
jgi:hypothetical protein